MTIRRQPSDFRVDEVLDPAFAAALWDRRDDRHTHAVHRLMKTSLTTPEAAARLARALGVRPGAVEYAGLKDKHAETTQHLSVRWSGTGDPPAHIADAGWRAELVGWSAVPLAASHIHRNRFVIVVRGLSREASADMERRATLLRTRDSTGGESTLTFTNYFGDQRFGSARFSVSGTPEFIGARLVRGDFESALRLELATPQRKDTGAKRTATRLAARLWGDWKSLERELPRFPGRRPFELLAGGRTFRDAYASLPHALQQLHVEAYQAHLWNAIATRMCRLLAPEPLRAEDPFGEMLFPVARSIPPAWMDLSLPQLASDSVLLEPWASAAHAVLTHERIALDKLRVAGLRRPAFREAPRALFARAERFVLGDEARDELAAPRSPKHITRTLTFDLPRGSYATVLLRALGQ